MRLVQRIVPRATTFQLRDTSVPPTLILHTNGASHAAASLYNFITGLKPVLPDGKSNPIYNVFPHGQVAFDGTVEQYVPWDRRAFVQYDGNAYAISLETEDSGYDFVPIDRDPWTDDQLHAIAQIAILNKIPPRACTSPKSGGVGYHSQFRDAWNRSGHNCPGSRRRDQIPQILAYMTQVVIANVPPPTPLQEEDVPYLLISLAGYQNIVAAFPNGAIRQMPLSEYLFLRDVGKVPSVTETTPDGIERILLVANMDHSELVKV